MYCAYVRSISMYVLCTPSKRSLTKKNASCHLVQPYHSRITLDHSGSFGWSTREVPSVSTSMSTGKSTEKAMHMMTHTSMWVPHQKYVYIYTVRIICIVRMYVVSVCMFWALRQKGVRQKKIGSDEFRMILRWWLGVPILDTKLAGTRFPQCGSPIDIFGDHAVSCN